MVMLTGILRKFAWNRSSIQ